MCALIKIKLRRHHVCTLSLLTYVALAEHIISLKRSSLILKHHLLVSPKIHPEEEMPFWIHFRNPHCAFSAVVGRKIVNSKILQQGMNEKKSTTYFIKWLHTKTVEKRPSAFKKKLNLVTRSHSTYVHMYIHTVQ